MSSEPTPFIEKTIQHVPGESAINAAKEIFADVSDLSLEDRESLLRKRCGDNADLRRAVESLLIAHDKAGSFLVDVTSALPSSDALVGQRIGRYKLLQAIGEGGFGTVYMAEQESPVRRRVALKIIKLGMETKLVIAQLEAERQALAMMDHPNIAKVFDAGITDSGRPYFVMELVNGVPVTSYCDANRLTARERLELFIPICQAVQHAHQKGIIHRDIKPTNVLLTLHDGRPTPKVIDFGIAKATQARLTEKTLFTEFHQMIGTPQYMSPEQAEMSGLDIDTRTDLYSLGVLLYELLTGTTPLDPKELRSKAYGEMQRIIREEEPATPSKRLSTMGEMLPIVTAQRRTDARQLGRLIRGDLDWIVMKCLEKDRARRYDSASGLAADVLNYLADEPVSAAKPSGAYRVRKYVRRHRTQVTMATTVACLLIAGITASTLGFIRAMRAEGVVRQQNDMISSERDHAVSAEAEAQMQRQKAETETRRAQLQLADSLISQGDALTSAGEFSGAYARFATALAQLQKLGSSLARLDLSLVRLYRASPPPLWTAMVPGGEPRAWVVLPSRREMLLAGDDKQYHALDLLTGESLRTFGDTHGVQSMAATDSANGPVVVVGGTNFVRIIDPVSGAVLRHADDDRARRFCALSPDGALAASVDQGGSVVFWNTTTLARLGEGRHGPQVTQSAFSHDGAMIATVSRESTVSLWDAKTFQRIRTFDESPGRGKFDAINTGVTFAADDKSVFCAEFDGGVAQLSLNGEPLANWFPHKRMIRSIVVTDEGQRVITAADDGNIRISEAGSDGIWKSSLTLAGDLAERNQVAYVGGTGRKSGAAAVGLPATDQGVAVGIDSVGRVYAWPLVVAIRPENRLQFGMALSHDGLILARDDGDGHTRIRDAATGRAVRDLANPGGSNADAFSPDGRVFYAGNNGGTIQAIDLAQSKSIWSIHAHEQEIWTIDVSGDGAFLATGGKGGIARLWDARNGTLVRSLPGHAGEVRAVAFVPEPTTSTKSPVVRAKPSLVGKRLIVASGSAGLFCDWDLGTEDHPRRISMSGNIKGVSFSPDGKLLAVATNNHTIPFFDAATLQPAGLMSPVPSVWNVVFIDSGDGLGQWALSGSDELRAWDLNAKEERLVLDSHTGNWCNTLRTSSDGKCVYAVGAGRINLTLPRQYRELSQDHSPLLQAAWYAEWGAWAWTRELLQRERSAGRDVSALLLARANWMCGDAEGARQAFDLAVARREIPSWYAELCLSVVDTPLTITSLPAAPQPPDIIVSTAGPEPLAEGVVSASAVAALKGMIGQEVVVEGLVTDSVWSKQGKHLTIDFAGDEENATGLVCDVSRKFRENFDAVFGGDAARAFSGARLQVRGKLSVYSGKRVELTTWPEMILEDPRQVTILSQPADRE